MSGASAVTENLPFVPDSPAALSGKPVLVASGARDPYVSREKRDQLVATLRAGGAEVTETLTPAGHELTDEELAPAAGGLDAVAAP